MTIMSAELHRARCGRDGVIGMRGRSLARMPLTATSESKSDQAADRQQQRRLGQHQREHVAVGEADGLQDRQLRDSLAHRLRHGVAGEKNEREEHRGHDAADDEADVGELAGEGGLEGGLALGLGLMIGIGREGIDRLRDAVGVLRLRDALDVPAAVPPPNWVASSK